MLTGTHLDTARTAPADELLEMGDALLELDASWRIVRVNANQERLSRRPRSQTVGRTIWDVFPEIASPETEYSRQYRRCMTDRVPVQFQDYYAPLALWTGVTAYPTSTGGIAIFFRDISPMKVAQQEQERLADIVESTDDAIVSKDLSGVVRTWNPAAERLFGYTAEEMIGTPIARLLPPDRLGEEERILQELRAGRRVDHFETERSRKDGTIVEVAVTVSPLFDDDGEIRGASKIARDITERKRAERALREQQSRLERDHARLRAIVDTIPVGLFIVEADGRVSLTNDAAKRIWAGAVALETVDSYVQYRAFWPATGERLKAEDWPAAQALVHGRRTEGLVLDIERFDGSRGTIVVSCSPIVDPAGQVIGAVAANQDISELRAAQEQVAQADRRKNEFLAVLGHEARNILAPIRNSIFLLERVPAEGPQASRARQVIGRQTDHLTRLVDDLLDVTRIGRGKIRLERKVADLRDVVRRACEDHRALFEDSEIDLHLDFPAGPVWADVDPTRITQVVTNLLVNAHKFTPARGTVTVELRKRDGHARIRIRDTGAGIEPRQIARLFEPYAQEDRTVARSRGGLGLGLALSKGLVELHGGRLTARSDGPGKGAEFEITLPVAAPTAGAAVTRAATARSPAVRVLIIEDSADAALTLKDVLEVMGHQATIARDGAAGVELARRMKPDVVLCDLGLPDMDGYEVARTLRRDPELRSTRLIALSGYAQPDDRERARASGFDAHLPKPAPLEELAAMLA